MSCAACCCERCGLEPFEPSPFCVDTVPLTWTPSSLSLRFRLADDVAGAEDLSLVAGGGVRAPLVAVLVILQGVNVLGADVETRLS